MRGGMSFKVPNAQGHTSQGPALSATLNLTRAPAFPRALLARRRRRGLKAHLAERIGAVRAARAPLACAVRPQVAATALPGRRPRLAAAAAPDRRRGEDGVGRDIGVALGLLAQLLQHSSRRRRCLACSRGALVSGAILHVARLPILRIALHLRHLELDRL
eukprot:6275652-Prymnesium_polylepis.1